MKNIIATIFISVFILGVSTAGVRAQMMQGSSAITDDHTAREEAAGKVIWEKFQARQIACDKLTDDDFDALGEYFMGQMMGSSHAAMNTMMTQMMGGDGEAQMHIVMGKRLSGCDASAAFPVGGSGFVPMMNMMMGGGMMGGGGNSMMNFGYGFGFFGWTFMILLWVLIIAALVALVKWIANQFRSNGSKSALDILKDRYAKGEIDKKEFEEKKKDLA